MLDYTPRSPRDYGTLSCWATNTVGTQADPCRFTVIEAGPPERVGNCVLVNLTINSLEVGCTPGNDGGLQQRFVARVYAAPTHTLLATLQEDHSPRFQVGGLTPGQDYLIAITAVNAKGASQPQQINAVRLKVAEKRMGEVATPPVSPLVGVFLGLVGGFVLLLLAGVLLSRARSNRCRCLGERGGERDVVTSGSSPTTTTTPSSAHALTFHSEKERAAPDVLRTINETAELLDTRICPEIIPPRVPPPPYSRTQTQQQQQQQQQGLLRGTLQVTPLAAAAASGTGRALYRDTPSPLHLLHEESFV
nr:nephrin-like [Procambarus clarkii]